MSKGNTKPKIADNANKANPNHKKDFDALLKLVVQQPDKQGKEKKK